MRTGPKPITAAQLVAGLLSVVAVLVAGCAGGAPPAQPRAAASTLAAHRADAEPPTRTPVPSPTAGSAQPAAQSPAATAPAVAATAQATIAATPAAVTAQATVAAAPSPVMAQATIAATPSPGAQRRPFTLGVTVADASDAPDRSFALARQAGLTHAYVVVDWANVLHEGGRFAWDAGQANDVDNFLRAARAHNVRLVVRLGRPQGWTQSLSRLDPSLMERFAEGVASRARGVAAAYEVLNEPNLSFEWGGPPDPAAYARLLAAAHRGVKRADPAAVVLAAGLSPYTGGQAGTMEDVDFLRSLYAAGAKGTFDALAMHAYGGPRPPDQDPAGCGLCFRRVELYRRVMVERGDAETPAWITEFGYLHATNLALGPYDWMKVSPQQQADYLRAAVEYARRHWTWLEGMVLFNLDFSTVPWNPPTSGAYWFALLNPDRTPRPAYLAVRDLARAAG